MTHRQSIRVRVTALVLLSAVVAVFWIGVWTVLGWVF